MHGGKATWAHSEKEAEEKGLTRNQTHQHLDLGLLASRYGRK